MYNLNNLFSIMVYCIYFFLCSLSACYLCYKNIFTVFLFSTVFLFTSIDLYTKSACIIVHGTWAKNESWYQSSGEFFEEIKKSNEKLHLVDEIVPFSWSGKLGYLAHLEAAKDLSEMILKYEFVFLVCHSYGATVGILAASILRENNTMRNINGIIDRFYALGVPVDKGIVAPDMNVINHFFNLFSFGDLIQTINGAYERAFVSIERLINISIELFSYHPSHSNLHNPIIGRNLLYIDSNLTKGFDVPGKIQFFQEKNLEFFHNNDQKKSLDNDRIACRLLIQSCFRSARSYGFDDDERA